MNVSIIFSSLCVVAAIGYAISQETPVGELRGRVLYPRTEKPMANVEIILSGGEDRWFHAQTDEAGEFAIARVPAGEYRVAARAPRYAADSKAVVIEGENTISLQTRRVYPKLPPPQTSPDPNVVRIRTLDIVRARYNLSPQLYRIIRDNNQSGLPLSIVLAQAGAESSFRPDLIGGVGEVGLFQLQLSTAADVAGRPVKASELLDPALNTRLATTYLRQMHEQFGTIRVALASYNQGPGNTMRRGLFLSAQVYADGTMRAAYHSQFQQRLRAIDPDFQRAGH